MTAAIADNQPSTSSAGTASHPKRSRPSSIASTSTLTMTSNTPQQQQEGTSTSSSTTNNKRLSSHLVAPKLDLISALARPSRSTTSTTTASSSDYALSITSSSGATLSPFDSNKQDGHHRHPRASSSASSTRSYSTINTTSEHSRLYASPSTPGPSAEASLLAAKLRLSRSTSLQGDTASSRSGGRLSSSSKGGRRSGKGSGLASSFGGRNDSSSFDSRPGGGLTGAAGHHSSFYGTSGTSGAGATSASAAGPYDVSAHDYARTITKGDVFSPDFTRVVHAEESALSQEDDDEAGPSGRDRADYDDEGNDSSTETLSSTGSNTTTTSNTRQNQRSQASQQQSQQQQRRNPQYPHHHLSLAAHLHGQRPNNKGKGTRNQHNSPSPARSEPALIRYVLPYGLSGPAIERTALNEALLAPAFEIGASEPYMPNSAFADDAVTGVVHSHHYAQQQQYLAHQPHHPHAAQNILAPPPTLLAGPNAVPLHLVHGLTNTSSAPFPLDGTEIASYEGIADVDSAARAEREVYSKHAAIVNARSGRGGGEVASGASDPMVMAEIAQELEALARGGQGSQHLVDPRTLRAIALTSQAVAVFRSHTVTRRFRDPFRESLERVARQSGRLPSEGSDGVRSGIVSPAGTIGSGGGNPGSGGRQSPAQAMLSGRMSPHHRRGTTGGYRTAPGSPSSSHHGAANLGGLGIRTSWGSAAGAGPPRPGLARANTGDYPSLRMTGTTTSRSSSSSGGGSGGGGVAGGAANLVAGLVDAAEAPVRSLKRVWSGGLARGVFGMTKADESIGGGGANGSRIGGMDQPTPYQLHQQQLLASQPPATAGENSSSSRQGRASIR